MGRLSKVGSTKHKSILESWKTGANSTWELKVDAVQVNKELMKVKRKNEIQLASEDTKRLKLEKEVQISKEAVKKEVLGRQKVQNELAATKDELRTVRKLNDQLTKCNKRLSYAVISQDKLQRRKCRGISTLSRQQQWSRKKQACANVNQALLFLEDEGVHATSVTLVYTETSQKEVLDLHQSTY